ncbi:MAG: hypothetical protein AAF664_14720, partial [Planctomycetota bacterium]
LPGARQSMMERVYYATREASDRNAIVLQIIGDDSPVRVLPLPQDGTPVYVSQLVHQSGLGGKLGGLDLTLFRYSTGSVSGLPMECKIDRDARAVRPETDYALHAGDRLQVSEATLSFSTLVNRVLGR